MARDLVTYIQLSAFCIPSQGNADPKVIYKEIHLMSQNLKTSSVLLLV